MEAFLTVGGDAHADAEMAGEMEIVLGSVGAAKLDVISVEAGDIIKGVDMLTTVNISIVAGAGKGDGATGDTARKTVDFVEPAVEIVGGEDGVVAGDISGEDVVVGDPGGFTSRESGDWEMIIAEGGLDDALESAFCPIETTAPFELAAGGIITGVDALVPISDGEGNGVWAVDGREFPGGGDAVFFRNVVEGHGAHERGCCNEGEHDKREAGCDTGSKVNAVAG